jgi:phosphocarrier protein FPr
MLSAPTLLLRAPLSGLLVAIDRVPDPVFAQRMVGDGISIDPTSAELLAPCDGTVVQLHASGHALTLRTTGDVEVMMHIGLETVRLRGEGFAPLVAIGDTVKTATPLVRFDADFVATHARSLLTQIVVTTMDRVASISARSGVVVGGVDAVAEITLGGVARAEEISAGEEIWSEPVTVPTAIGLHARPAAVLANAAKAFAADVSLVKGHARANAKSVVALMALEVGGHDSVRLAARGADAAEAIARLAALTAGGLGDPVVPPPAGADAARAPRAAEAAAPAPGPLPGVLTGVGASPGLAVGQAFVLRREDVTVERRGGDPREERRRLERAVDQARAELQALQARLRSDADAGKAAIFAAHEALLADPDLLDTATASIATGESAAFAWQRASSSQADRLAGLNNELLAARANDLRDVGRRVLRLLTGAGPERQVTPERAILVADDLTPSDTATLDRTRVLGFCTTGGGATSHVAILARALDLPAIVAIDPRALDLANGTPVVLDGAAGTLRRDPPAEEVRRIEEHQERHRRQRAGHLARALEPAVTRDGHRVEVAGNIGALADVEQLVALGGEGVGLLRSEFLFLDRAEAPTEDEQAARFGEIVAALDGRPAIVRTLDVGGDKPLSYLPMPREENPFLGERGIRLLLNRPDVLRAQVRAVLRASTRGTVRLMFPMIARLDEWRRVKALLEEETARLGVAPVPAGIMVEVPAAALLADQFAPEVDFFSIGTNDLTQYTLAMDRGHPKLAPQVDGLDPSVLRLIARTADAARAHGRWVGVCGGIAADPQAVPLLVGLGVDELSVSVPAIPAVKALVRTLDVPGCRALAERALQAASAADVRALLPGEDR